MPIQTKQDPNDKNKFLLEKQVNFWSEYKKTKPDLTEIYQYTNRPVAVLGGGPSLPDDLKKLPSNTIFMACNHHAFRLIKPDYMIFLDPPDQLQNPEFVALCNDPQGAKRISYANLDHTDYYTINEAKFHTKSDTGVFAIWVASFITSGKIYLCGFNLRNPAEPMHFYAKKHLTVEWGGVEMDKKIERFKAVRNGIERPERVEAVSGILQTVFTGKEYYEPLPEPIKSKFATVTKQK
jgi:hypothetical protein